MNALLSYEGESFRIVKNFSVVENLTSSNVTLKIDSKRSFGLREDPVFNCSYIPEKDYLEKVKKGGREDVLSKVKMKDVWVSKKEKVKVQIYDVGGNIISLSPEISELRDGKFEVVVPGGRAMKPGLYTLKVELEKDGQVYVVEEDFQWGLVSLNTEKSIYKPGENADFIIVVLDEDGRPVCNANVSLIVSDPDGGENYFSTDGEILPSGECGIYGLDYLTGVEGEYEIDVTAVIGGCSVCDIINSSREIVVNSTVGDDETGSSLDEHNI